MFPQYSCWDSYGLIKLDSVVSIDGLQVLISVPKQPEMQDDGADLRFCTPYGEEIKYAIESVESTYFSVWVKLPIGIGEFLFYYGNQEAESESSPDDVFDEFFDKNSTSGWDTSNIAVTTYGEYLRFYNPTSSLVGGAQRYDLDLPSKYIMEIRANQVSILSLTFL